MRKASPHQGDGLMVQGRSMRGHLAVPGTDGYITHGIRAPTVGPTLQWSVDDSTYSAVFTVNVGEVSPPSDVALYVYTVRTHACGVAVAGKFGGVVRGWRLFAARQAAENRRAGRCMHDECVVVPPPQSRSTIMQRWGGANLTQHAPASFGARAVRAACRWVRANERLRGSPPGGHRVT
ncbi:hypothetical protein ABZP36_008115 [Zizania latifolia]